MDRREGHKKDKIMFYEPPYVCDTLPTNHVYESFFELTRKCIIPSKGFGDGTNEQKLRMPKQYDHATINVNVSCL